MARESIKSIENDWMEKNLEASTKPVEKNDGQSMEGINRQRRQLAEEARIKRAEAEAKKTIELEKVRKQIGEAEEAEEITEVEEI